MMKKQYEIKREVQKLENLIQAPANSMMMLMMMFSEKKVEVDPGIQ